MGDENKDWEFWLDEYQKDMGDINIDAGSMDNSTWMDFDEWYKKDYENKLATNNITLTGGGEEMLRVAQDGFYVRGVRVEADAKEAQAVYEAFKQWMTWAIMNGEIKN